tara:strand:+ start:876 stop:1145 length:270 start_codon:yes stop_codon:yes gene_type:complete
MTEIKDIEEVELTYSSHMSFKIEDLSDHYRELWTLGEVKRFWVKYMTLYMELEDGTIVEEDVYTETNEDVKWPIKTFVRVEDDWSEWNE